MPDRFIKLVRDNAGDDRDQVVYAQSTLKESDFHWALKRKLIEEALEYLEGDSWDELVDVYEVLHALADFHGYGMGHLKIDAERKRRERGGFHKRMAMWIRRPSQ